MKINNRNELYNCMNFKNQKKEENKIKEIMQNNILTLRKKNLNKNNISKFKNNNISFYSPIEKNYFLTNFSYEITDALNKYYINLKNKNIFLYKSIINEEEIISKFSIDKNNLIKFILVQLDNYIEFMQKNYETNIENMKNFFDDNIINSLINKIYEYTNNNNIIKVINESINDNEIIIYNICKILSTLATISNYYTSLIINNGNNLQIIFLSLKYYNNINQILSIYLLIILYNCYLDDEIETLNKCNNLIPFILENLSNFHKSPTQNIIQSNLLLNYIEFLYKLLNEDLFNIYMNNPYINNCISLMINIIENYDNDSIKITSIKCLSSLMHCIDEKNNLKFNNLRNVLNILLPYLNPEINDILIVIKTLDIISTLTYLYEIDNFVDDSLIEEINHILIYFVIHKEDNKLLFKELAYNNKFNCIIEKIAVILLNCCLSKKIYDFILYDSSIIKNIIIIIYEYSIEISILKYLYNFLNEFMDNEDNFIGLILSNFLELVIVKSLDKYLEMRNYELILIVLDFVFKSLEYGNIFKEKNVTNNNNSKINFIQSYLDKKGFNDKLNLIASPDFGDMKCSEFSKKMQEIFFK